MREASYGDHAYVALYNSAFRSAWGHIDRGWLLSRVDFGVQGHTPVARFEEEDEAKSAEYALNEDLGWTDLEAYRIDASTMKEVFE